MRLSQKGYRVAVIELGKRLRANDFPKSNWNVCDISGTQVSLFVGLQRISLPQGVMVLHGAGVGVGKF